jgi:hypothetical protein
MLVRENGMGHVYLPPLSACFSGRRSSGCQRYGVLFYVTRHKTLHRTFTRYSALVRLKINERFDLSTIDVSWVLDEAEV